MKKFLFVVLFLFIFIKLFPQTLIHPLNLGFEDLRSGFAPPGWLIPPDAVNRKYEFKITEEKPAQGKYCLELSHNGENSDTIYGSVFQSIEANQYRGKRIRFKAQVRAEISSSRGSAHLFVRERFKDRTSGFYEMMEDNPIVIGEWKSYEILGEIDSKADIINFGLILKGSGKAWIDDCSFEIIQSDSNENEPPKLINEKNASNILAFADILGCIEYYYQGTEARKINWENLVLSNLNLIERSTDEKSLISNLNKIFNPIAPALLIFHQSEKEKIIFDRSKPNSAIDKIALGAVYTIADKQTSDSLTIPKIINIYNSFRSSPGIVYQNINPEFASDVKLTLSANVKADLIGPGSNCQLYIQALNADNQLIDVASMNDNPIISSNWNNYNVDFIVPANTNLLRIGIVLIGDGKCEVDNIKLMNKTKKKEIEIKNKDFSNDKYRGIPKSWILTMQSTSAGYYFYIEKDDRKPENNVLCISSDEKTQIIMPQANEPYWFDTFSNVSAVMPLNLYIDSLGTLPHPVSVSSDLSKSRSHAFIPNYQDRLSRLYTVIRLYNIIKHFSYNDYNLTEFNKTALAAIQKASLDTSLTAFSQTLKELLYSYKDGFLKIWNSDQVNDFSLPFLWEYVMDKLIVTQTENNFTKIESGSEIIEINGEKTQDLINRIISTEIGISNKDKIKRGLANIRIGKENDTVNLKVCKKDSSIIKDNYKKNVSVNSIIEKRLDPIAEIDSNIYYFDLTRLSELEFRKTFLNLQNALGFVFDLRGNTETNENLLGLFTKNPLKSINWKIPVFTKPDRRLISYNYTETSYAAPKLFFSGQVAFLTDSRTIGNSVDILGIARENTIGKIFGTKTAPFDGNEIIVRLPCNFYLSMTGFAAKFDKIPNINMNGIEPDIFIERKVNDIIDGRDELIGTALYFIKNKKNK
ncbi:MAG: S41 family peptidase [Candidatus Kapabacteria bacterium]|nr:S41 family peptidase [Candidatus Kapabacteria bacterium]